MTVENCQSWLKTDFKGIRSTESLHSHPGPYTKNGNRFLENGVARGRHPYRFVSQLDRRQYGCCQMSTVDRVFIQYFQIKFEQYWPNLDKYAIYGPFRVTLEKSEVHSSYVTRVLHLTHSNFEESRLVSDFLPTVLISTVNLMSDIPIPLHSVARSWSARQSSNAPPTVQTTVSDAFSRFSFYNPLQVGVGLSNV